MTMALGRSDSTRCGPLLSAATPGRPAVGNQFVKPAEYNDTAGRVS